MILNMPKKENILYRYRSNPAKVFQSSYQVAQFTASDECSRYNEVVFDLEPQNVIGFTGMHACQLKEMFENKYGISNMKTYDIHTNIFAMKLLVLKECQFEHKRRI